MRTTYCLSLCETAEKHLASFGNDPHAMLAAYVTQASFPACHRLDIGSSFCAQRLLSTPSAFYRAVLELCQAYELRVTLTLPIATQASLADVKDRASSIKSTLGLYLDEMTVNDFGMLDYVSNTYDTAVNLGRLFSRDHRDPRYPESYETTHRPDILSFDLDALRAAYPSLRGIEIDPTAPIIDASDAPSSWEVALHTPYCYISTSHLCEYASCSKAPDRAFRTECPCASECLDYRTRYEEENGVHFLKFGKTVYYYHPQARVRNAANLRLVYTPFEMGC